MGPCQFDRGRSVVQVLMGLGLLAACAAAVYLVALLRAERRRCDELTRRGHDLEARARHTAEASRRAVMGCQERERATRSLYREALLHSCVECYGLQAKQVGEKAHSFRGEVILSVRADGRVGNVELPGIPKVLGRCVRNQVQTWRLEPDERRDLRFPLGLSIYHR